MAPLSDYVTGTITLTNGSATFTGVGTGWQAAAFREGDTIIDVSGATEFWAVIATIEDNGQGTLTQPWEGPDLNGVSYRMRYMADGQRTTAQARQLIELLGNGNLQALAGLDGTPQTFAMFTGQGAMVEVPRSELLSGLDFDVQVATLADRDAYDNEVEGFKVLVSDANGEGDPALYTKMSDDPGDWSAPAFVAGAPPVPTITIGDVTTGAPGSPAQVTSTPTETGAELDFTIPTGAEGPAGAQGPEGPTGPIPEVTIGDVTTGAPGSPAEVTATPTPEGVELEFVIPTGPEGPEGPQGPQGPAGEGTGDVIGPETATAGHVAVFADSTGTLLADGGEPPTAPTVEVGTTTTGAAGTDASVSVTATATGVELDFTIPRGDAGADGAQGPAGDTPTVEVGTTTTGDPGTDAEVTATPTATGVSLDFTIPRGEGGGGGAGYVPIAQFNPVGDGVADDTAALQAGIDYCSPLGLVLVLDPEQTYRTTAPLVALHGQDDSGGPVYRPKIDGRGAVIAQDHDGWCLVIDPLCEWVDQTSRRGVATFFIKDISFDGYAHINGNLTNASCIKIGKAGYWVDPFDRPAGLENILINGYHATAVQIEQCRHFDINRLVVRDPVMSAATVVLRTLQDGFTGDITFNDCEFAGNTNDGVNNSGCLFMHCERLSGTGQAQLRGIRFVNCVFYGTGTYLYSGGNSQLNDTWFTDCAWDWTNAGGRVRTDYAFKFRATNAGAQIDKLFVNNPYMVGYPGGGFLADNPSENGSFSDIQFRGGAVSNGSIPMEFIYVDGVSVIGMDFSAITGIDPERNILSFPDCSDLVVKDCRETNGVNVDQFISVGGGRSGQSYVCEGNVSLTPGTERAINDYGDRSKKRRMANNRKPGDVHVLTGSDPMVIPYDGDVFLVNSPVNFGQMLGVIHGRRITLVFYGTCTIYTGTNSNEIAYSDGSTKEIANGEVVSFISDGNRWWLDS